MDAVMETKELSKRMDVIAPDGSEIRLLANTSRGSMVHCSLPARQTSKAVCHKTVEELWYFISGQGKVWRKYQGGEELSDVHPGISLNIPSGAVFQFQNNGDEPLSFVIVTMPPWPSEEEATASPGYW